MSRVPRIAVLTLAVLTALVGGVLPAHAEVVLDDGHVDGVWVKYVSPNLQLWVGDHTGGGLVERAPADVTLRAKPESQITVPASPNPACLGTPGNSAWVLPQVENPALLWLGWSAESIAPGDLDGNQVTLKLKSATPLSGVGVFCVYSKSGLSTTKIFDSSDGVTAADSVVIPVGSTGHRHVNWAFTSSGPWTVVFEVTATVGGVAKSSGNKTYNFSIA